MAETEKVGSANSLMINIQSAFQLRDLRHYHKMIPQRAAAVDISKSRGGRLVLLKICTKYL